MGTLKRRESWDGCFGWPETHVSMSSESARSDERFRNRKISVLIRFPRARPCRTQEASSAIFQEHLKKALNALGEPHRSIVVLREVQEYKYEEISEVLNLPLNTVKVYLHRARKTLRKELGEVLRHDYA